MGSKTASFESELTDRLKSAGITSVDVRHEPGEGYYVAPVNKPDAYSAIGDIDRYGFRWRASYLTRSDVEAFVSGLIVCKRAGL